MEELFKAEAAIIALSCLHDGCRGELYSRIRKSTSGYNVDIRRNVIEVVRDTMISRIHESCQKLLNEVPDVS